MNGDFCFVLLMSHLCNDKAKQLGAQMGLIMKEFVEGCITMMDKRKLLKLVVLAFRVSILLLVFGYTNGPKIVDEHTIRYVLNKNHQH